jgi:hypothetical protein
LVALFFFLKGMTGALAPLSYLVFNGRHHSVLAKNVQNKFVSNKNTLEQMFLEQTSLVILMIDIILF